MRRAHRSSATGSGGPPCGGSGRDLEAHALVARDRVWFRFAPVTASVVVYLFELCAGHSVAVVGAARCTIGRTVSTEHRPVDVELDAAPHIGGAAAAPPDRLFGVLSRFPELLIGEELPDASLSAMKSAF